MAINGNARIDETTPAALVVCFSKDMVELDRAIPDPESSPPGDYSVNATGEIYIQAHGFDPARWLGVWSGDTAYTAGDVVFSNGEISSDSFVLKSESAGNSGAVEPDWSSIGTTDDGDLVWKTLGSIRDLCPVTNVYILEPQIQIHEADSKVSPQASATVVVDAPSNLADGDLVILIRHDSSTSNKAAPAGFTQIIDVRQGVGFGNVGHITAWYRIASSEPASYSVALANWGFASAHRVTGFDEADPIAASVGAFNTADTTSLEIPGITIGAGDVLISALAGRLSNGGALAINGGMVKVVDESGNAFAGAALDNDPGAGATGTRTWTWTTERRAAAALIAIRPA